MITKKELVKIISKKAAVVDTSAKELFDRFLRRIATELQPGESAQFSNVGYFYFRKGKVKKEGTGTEESRIEYLDLIIFSSSGLLDLKSADNLVFSVPDGAGGGEDNLDAHFSLSVGKPVLPNLEGSKSAAYSTDELQEILNRKVENLMVNLQKDESSITDSEILLVDIKVIDQDQFELELDEDAELNNSSGTDKTIHSSEQLKSIAWSFGKDLSNHIKDKSLSKQDAELSDMKKSSGSEFEDREWDDTASENEIDMDEFEIEESPEEQTEITDIGPEIFEVQETKPVDESEQMVDIPEDSNEETIIDKSEPGEEKTDKSEQTIIEELNIPEMQEPDIVEPLDGELEETFNFSENNIDEVLELTDEKIEDSIDVDKLTESLMEEVDLKDLEIDMDDFEISDNEEKMGNFERVRSISSSFGEDKPLEDIEGFDNFIEDKIDIGRGSIINKDGIEDVEVSDDNIELRKQSKPKGKTEVPAETLEKKKVIKLNRIDSKKSRQKYNRKNSTVNFLLIFAVFVGVIGVIYLLTKSDQSSELYDEVTMSPGKSENTTYVERTYDIPVNYPYEKSEDNLQVTGLNPSIETTDIKPEENNVETKPPVEVVQDTQEPTVGKSGQKPPGVPEQAAYSIYRYNNIFIVQVAAFNSQAMALEEVWRFTSMGYNSFIERATIDGRLWYRVRVGNFNSLEKAKQFRTSQN